MGRCKIHLQNELKEKQERGEDLTGQEQAIVQADDDELSDVVPKYYGPLSSANVAYCPFCHWMGQLGAIAVGVLVWWLAEYAGGNPNTSFWIGGLVWAALAIYIGFRGHFPVLGPRLGPHVERFLAALGIYVTATARREYRDDEDDTSDAPEILDTEVVEDDSVELPDDYFDAQEQRFREQLQHYKTKLESTQKSLRQERAEKLELEQERDEYEKDLKKAKQNEIPQKEQCIEELRSKKDELEKQIEHLADFGYDTGDDDRQQNRIPVFVPSANGGGYIGPYWLVKTVDVHLERDPYYGTYTFAYVVNSQGAQLPNHIPDTIDWEQAQRWSDHLLPNPETVLNPPEYEHPGKQGYPQVDLNEQPLNEYPPRLFQENKALVRENRKEAQKKFGELQVKQVSLTLSYCKIQNDRGDFEWYHVPPRFDVRGFENTTELRNRANKRHRQIRSLQSKLRQKDEHITDLDHKLSVLEEQLEMKDGFLSDVREEAKEAVEAATRFEHHGETERRMLNRMTENALTKDRLLDEALEGKRKEESKRIEDATDTTRTIEQYENMHNRERTVDKFFQMIRGAGWNRTNGQAPFDYKLIESGEADVDKEDVIREFREEVDPRDDQFGRIAKAIDRELAENIATDGGGQ